MPFFPPYEKKFELGDLIFGLHSTRKDYSNRVDLFAATQTIDCIYMIDQYAVTVTEREVQQQYSRLIPPNQGDLILFLESHIKYRSAINARGFPCLGNPVHDPNDIARKVKGGLQWALTRDITIHFLLDGLDLNQVVRKSHSEDKYGKAFTGVELRWVFRNKAHPNVQSNIQFWLNKSPTPPPWTKEYQTQNGIHYDVTALWGQYQPKNLQ